MNIKNQYIRKQNEKVFSMEMAAGFINKDGFNGKELQNLLIHLGCIQRNFCPNQFFVLEGYFTSIGWGEEIEGVGQMVYQTDITIKGLNFVKKLVKKHVE